MGGEPVVVRGRDLEWETWGEGDVAERGRVFWKTLISASVTRSEALTVGIARVPPGEGLNEHWHQQAEVYLVIEGSGVVRIDSRPHPVEAGSAVFIPGNVAHSCENTGASELHFAYVFPADSFEEVEYVF